MHGDGEQSRDFTYVENVVEANLLAADAPGAGGRVLNVATGGSETVNDARRDDRPAPRPAGRDDATAPRSRATCASRGPT